MEKENCQLNLGLDIGSNSVGWALLDEDNKLVRKNRFTFWGVRMFDEASNASETRINRNARRRLRRRKYKLNLLKEIFEEEIIKVDKNFFMKMEDSFYASNDKRSNEIYDGSFGLFNYRTKNKSKNNSIDTSSVGYIFYKQSPTVYHLRKYIMDANEKVDIRLLFLAIHNIIKFRGNFLIPGDEFKDGDYSALIETFDEFNKLNLEFINSNDDTEGFNNDYYKTIDLDFNNDFFVNLEKIINDKTKYKKEKLQLLMEMFGVEKKTLASEYLIPLLLGSKVDVAKLTVTKPEKFEKAEIILSSESFLEDLEKESVNAPGYESLFGFAIKIKGITDFYYLKKLLNGNKLLSDAMIEKYNEHKEDLASLKKLIKKYLPKDYFEIFRNCDVKKNNYVHYVGRNNLKNVTKRFSHAKRVDFYTFIKTYLVKLQNLELSEKEKERVSLFLSKIENDDFLLRQNSEQNGSLPMQLHLKELKNMLIKQKKYYPFLEKITDGLTNIDKIISIFKSKIPYYVGPLTTNNEKSKNSWMLKREEYNDVKITPWNMDSVIDKESTAELFIKRMQNKCSYLKGDNDYCLPKKSLIFSEYDCLCWLNKIRINGAYLTTPVKLDLLDNVFKKISKPTKKNIIDYLRSNHGELQISTSNGKELSEIVCNMSSYVDMSRIIGEKQLISHYDECEDIIKYITLFEDKNILESKLHLYKFLNQEAIKKIKSLNYSKWSSLSKNLLHGKITYDSVDASGEIKHQTILQIMRKTNLNLMEILNSKVYNLNQKIDQYNLEFTKEESSLQEFLDENITISPIMHRPLIQSIAIIEEIEKIFGRKIDKFYIECNRTNKATKKKQPTSRYEQLKSLYSSCKNLVSDYNELIEELDCNKNKLQSDKIYLYFTQLGKSMYTNQKISLADVISGNGYDIDHIYPQSLIKDDSFSNRVLVEKKFNSTKSDKFLYEVETINIQSLKNNLWDILLDKNLISKEKYRRLTQTSVSSEELGGFVSRQIVATNQSEKALSDVLKLYKKVDVSNIIFSKAENISEFRKTNGLVKSRIANNYHHAHDAYLNVVVGGTLDKYYKKIGVQNFGDYERIKNKGLALNPIKILRWNRSLNGNIIYDIEKYKNSSFQTESFKLLWNADLELGKPKYEETFEKVIDEETGEVTYKNTPVHSYFPDATQECGRIYYDLYKRFDIHETKRTYNKNKLLAKVTINPKGQGAVPLKESESDPRSNIKQYGGYASPSYSRYVAVRFIEKKNKINNKLIAIPGQYDSKNEATARKNIRAYIELNKKTEQNQFEILNYNIKINSVLAINATKSYITGVTNDSFVLQNKNDRNYNYEELCAIKKLEKYNLLITNKKEPRYIDDNEVVLAEAKNDDNNQITLKKDELKLILEAQIRKFNKKIYDYSIISKIKFIVIDEFDKFDFSILASITNEYIKMLKTNERQTMDLSLLGLSKNYGALTFSSLNKCKLIHESITGYYKKILFEDK